jgi:pimeloyl-ACP methyl ester carboxylesterase
MWVRLFVALALLLLGADVESNTASSKVILAGSVQKAIIIFCGYGCGKTPHFEKQMKEAGYLVFRENLPTRTCDAYLHAARAAYQRVLDDPRVDHKETAFVGFSMGGYFAPQVAASFAIQPKWLVLQDPANYEDSACLHAFKDYIDSDEAHFSVIAWRWKTLNESDTISLAATHAFTGRTVVVCGELDTVVPDPTCQNYARAAKHGKKIVLMGQGHSPEVHHRHTPRTNHEEWLTLGRIILQEINPSRLAGMSLAN